MKIHWGVSLWVFVACVLSFVLYSGLVAYQAGAYPEQHALFSAALGLSGNLVASFVLYYLAVVFPDARKRRRIKRNCLKSYKFRKRLLLHAIVSASVCGGRKDLSGLSEEDMDGLMHFGAFRKAFEGGVEADEGFYAFSNYVQSHDSKFRAIVFELNLIARELNYVLNNFDIDDDELFETVKRIETLLFTTRTLHADYEDEKLLSNLIWEMFAGFSLIEGYRDYDPIEKAIRSL